MPRVFAVATLVASLALAGAALANPTSQDPTKAPAGTYELDKRHAALLVKIAHLGGFSHYTMRFTGLEGGYTFDPANWQATKLTINVDPKSIDTEDPSFNKQITGYFDVEKYPTISFVSTAIDAGADGKGTVTGDLTFHGVTKPVTLDVAFNGSGPGMLGAGTRMGFSGVAHIKRSDFGVTAMHQFAGDDIDLQFEVEFVKK